MFRKVVIHSVLFIFALVPSVAAEAAQKRSRAKPAAKAKPATAKSSETKTVAEKPLTTATIITAEMPKPVAADFKIESIGALNDAKVSDAVKAVLQDKGMRLINKDGKTIVDLWWRKEIPNSVAALDGSSFGTIKDGVLVGVITFPEKSNDYRDQSVQAGTYTLRYGLSAQDGAHLGVSPTRDFFMLALPNEDTDPKDLSAAEVIKLSRVASGTGHPAPMALTTTTIDEKIMPKLVAGEHEHVTLELKLKLKSGEVAIGFVVVGKTAE
jgi:hypothetical protein